MTTRFIILVFGAFLFWQCGGNGSSDSSTNMIDIPVDEDGNLDRDEIPKISFDETVLNIGKISQGEVITHNFDFTNTGKVPLIIATVKGSCGCTIPRSYPTGEILPGEGGTIEIEFDSDGLSGEHVVSIIVSANTFPAATQLVINTEIVVPDNMK
jgi:hypothetical protein